MATAVITPAISVLSAIEGLKLVTPAFDSAVIPLSIVVLADLFWMQSRGTDRVSRYFGPDHGGLVCRARNRRADEYIRNLRVLSALDPDLSAFRFVWRHGVIGLTMMGLVFLAARAPKRSTPISDISAVSPIQDAWIYFVFPALLLNYFGQGALLLSNIGKREYLDNPFYRIYPDWALMPMVMLSTVATVIASQAVITGAFLIDAAGHSARCRPALRNSPHLGKHVGPDLYAESQLAALLSPSSWPSSCSATPPTSPRPMVWRSPRR